MIITLYNFAKKTNSTKRPDSSVQKQEANCNLKDSTSVLNPVLTFDIGFDVAPSYNYCYIPDFNRYYFINDWTYTPPVWSASLAEDYLATYKDQILADSEYVVRAQSAYDGDVLDALYPAKYGTVITEKEYASPWLHDDDEMVNLKQGVFVVGLQDQHGSIGSLSYRVLDYTQMAELVYALLNNIITADHGYDFDQFTQNLQRDLVDPLKYIASCYWYPILFDSLDLPKTDSLHVQIWQLDDITNKLLSTGWVKLYSGTLYAEDHPEKSTRGNYLNGNQYRKVYAHISPFGLIPIDADAIGPDNAIRAEVLCDLITGQGTLRIRLNGGILTEYKAQIGVPIKLSQNDFSKADVAGSVAGVAGVIAAAATGGASEMAAALGQFGVSSATFFGGNPPSTIGSTGSLADLSRKWFCTTMCYLTASEDIERFGRPLCQQKTLSELSGYARTQSADILLTGWATEAEVDNVNSAMDNGFYIE